MAKSIDIIRSEHRALAAVLSALKAVVEGVESKQYAPDFALLSAMLLLWKIIHMGEIFGRNASLYPAREAFADLLTLDALAAFGGTVGLMVVLATVLPFLLPSSSKAKQI